MAICGVQSRCADLDRLDRESNSADSRVAAATAQLRDARLAARDSDDAEGAARAVELAQQALLTARTTAQQAKRTARQLGSGEPGDKPVPSTQGSVVSFYA